MWEMSVCPSVPPPGRSCLFLGSMTWVSWPWNIWRGSAPPCWPRCCCPPVLTPSPRLFIRFTPLVSCFIASLVCLWGSPQRKYCNSQFMTVCRRESAPGMFLFTQMQKSKVSNTRTTQQHVELGKSLKRCIYLFKTSSDERWYSRLSCRDLPFVSSLLIVIHISGLIRTFVSIHLTAVIKVWSCCTEALSSPQAKVQVFVIMMLLHRWTCSSLTWPAC